VKLRNYGKAQSYVEVLKMHTLKELNEMGKAWHIKGRSKMKKDQMVKAIVETIEADFNQVCLTLNKEHILLMDNLEALPKNPAYHTMEIKELMSLGLLFHGQEGYLAYPKWSEKLKSISDQYPGAIENNSFVKICLEAIIAYRGIIQPQEAVEIIQAVSNNELPKELIEMILAYTIGRTRNVYETEGYLHDHRLGEIDKRVDYLNTSNVKESYNISLEDVVYYSKNFHIYKGQAYEDFMKVLMPKYLVSMQEVIHTMDQLNLMITYGYKPSDFMRMMAGNFKITDGQELKVLADACMAFYNEMPQWLIKGYSPDQLTKIKARPVRKQKISRNSPCPCGSGKKYKQCCLNK